MLNNNHRLYQPYIDFAMPRYKDEFIVWWKRHFHDGGWKGKKLRQLRAVYCRIRGVEG